MAKKQGKVKMVSLKYETIQVGMIVLTPIQNTPNYYNFWSVISKGMVIDTWNLRSLNRQAEFANLYDSNNQLFHCVAESFELKTLVVEYLHDEDNGIIIPRHMRTMKTVPLKYSQWQSSIDNGEVDADKVVTFEVITERKRYEGDGDTYLKEIAKIIPIKTKISYLHSDEETATKVEQLLANKK